MTGEKNIGIVVQVKQFTLMIRDDSQEQRVKQ